MTSLVLIDPKAKLLKRFIVREDKTIWRLTHVGAYDNNDLLSPDGITEFAKNPPDYLLVKAKSA